MLLGGKWLASIPILQVLAWSVGPIYMSNVMGITLDSMARLKTKLRIQASVFGILLLLMLYASRTGKVTDIALAIVAAEWVRLCMMSWTLIRLLRIDRIDSLRIATGVSIIAATSATMVYVASHVLFHDQSVFSQLFGEVLFGAIGLGAGFLLSRPVISKNPAVTYLAGRIPLVAKILGVRRI